MVAAKRFFMHHSVAAALPKRNKMALAGFMDMLMRRSWSDDEGLYVDTSQGELGDECGVSTSTIRRWEKSLVTAGLLRVARIGAPSRMLEILDPSADRAVDNDVGKSPHRESDYVTSDAIIQSPVSGRKPVDSIVWRGSERGRLGRPEPARQRKASAAQTADARQVARGIVHSISQRLSDACPSGCDVRPWRLGRSQTAEVEDRIAHRLTAINRGTVTDLAVDLTRRDVDRLVEYSLKAAKPAAYLHRAISKGDWRCDPAPGSQAASVAEAGKAAEMPVQDLGARSGLAAVEAEPDATAAETEALERILEASGAPENVRVAARRIKSGAQVCRTTAKLTRAWMATMASQEAFA